MNNSQFYRLCAIAFLLLVSLSFGVQSCNKKAETDTKEIADDQNDAKFDERANDDSRTDDAEFLVEITELNLKGVELGRLAQQKGTSQSVKDHGKMMETEHRQLGNALNDLAARKDISLPTALTEDGKEAYKGLNEEKQDSFDKAYLDKMISIHEEGIEELEQQASRTQDEEIRNWANANLESWRAHLTHTREAKNQLRK